MTNRQSRELISKKMKDRGIEVGSGISNKIYDSKQVYQLIYITDCFPDLRVKK